MNKNYLPKIFIVLKEGYNKQKFLNDLIAGIIVGIVALPLSIALAIASGVSPEKGLYTAIIGGFAISFFGGSRVQIGGPTGAFVVIIYGIIQKYGYNGLLVATSNNYANNVVNLGISGAFVEHGTVDELQQICKIDVISILKTISTI